MRTAPIFDTIKQTILSFLPGARIVLFGSHAHGTATDDSDYDLLIITPATLSERDQTNWRTKLHKAVVRAVHAPVDLLLYSEQEAREKCTLPGHIVRIALAEGVTL